MKQFRRIWWLAGGLLLGTSAMSGCGSEPSCEDLANCTSPSGGSSGSTSGSGSSSGGMTGPEDCTNGLDDDKDGSIDCMDSECMDKFTCVPKVPAGFTEIVTITVAPYGEPSPACPGGAMPKPFYQNPAVDACDACTCDATGVSCTPGQLATAFDQTCTNVNPVIPPAAGQCQSGFGTSAVLQTAPTTTGTCTASTSSGPPKPPMETTIATCPVGNSDGAGCGMAGACVPSDGLATAEHICIKKVGHDVCPGEWPLALYAYESFTDDRSGCTPCGCTAACEGGKYTIFPNDKGMCAAGTGMAVDTVGACVVAGAGFFQLSISMTELKPSCTTTGGQMMGSVKPMTETTFCCN